MFRMFNTILKGNRIYHFGIVIVVMTLLVFLLENRYDYLEYQKQWKFFLNGGNPWDYASNSYGPLHNLLAYLYDLHPKLPRFLFSILALTAAIILINEVDNSTLSKKYKKVLFYFVLYNPIIWVMFVVNGTNDGLLGFLLLTGVICYERKYIVLSALLITLGILLKYIPLFVLPVLYVSSKKVNWKFVVSSIVTLSLGFYLTYFFWGSKFLNPVLYNSHRESKILSIFRYLRGEYSFSKWLGIESLDFLSVYLVVFSVLTVFILQFIYKWSWSKSLVLSLLSVYAFYLLGHFQFYFSIYLIVIWYATKLEADEHIVQRYILYFVCWIAGLMVLYAITEGFYQRFAIIREFIGLPNFIVILMLILVLLKNSRSELKNIE